MTVPTPPPDADDDRSSFDEGDDDVVAEENLGLFARIPLALQVLTVAELAGRVRDVVKLSAKPTILEEDSAQGTAEKLSELTKAFALDLEQLAQKWMKALGPMPSDEREAIAQMNLIMIAGFTALGTRYHLVERILRMSVARPRLKALDKSCQARAREFLKRPGDGQPGIRRVK